MKINTRGGFIDRQQKVVEVVKGRNRRSFPFFSFIFFSRASRWLTPFRTCSRCIINRMTLRAVLHVSFSAEVIGHTLRLHKTLIFTVQLRNSTFL